MKEDIRARIIKLVDDSEYQKFSASLIPGADNILGVRLPILKELAKELAKENYEEVLDESIDIYFEETMVRGFVIGYIKEDISIVIKQVERFLPRITNWSICDSFCMNLKVTKKHKEELWKLILKYSKSKKTYEIRFALVLFLAYFIDEKYLDQGFSIIREIKSEEYYVKMAMAWAVSICFVKFPKETEEFLKNDNLDKWTRNKSIQKIRESRRVSKDDKERLLQYKIS